MWKEEVVAAERVYRKWGNENRIVGSPGRYSNCAPPQYKLVRCCSVEALQWTAQHANVKQCVSILSRVNEWLQTGSRLVIWLIEHLQIVTTTVALSLIHTLRSSPQHALSLLGLLCLHYSFSGNGFQRRTFPSLWVPALLPCLRYQLLTAEL
jgi:hypothetical protein